MKTRQISGALLGAAIVAASCGGSAKPATDPLAGKYALGGGGGAIAVVKALTNRFAQLHPGVNFDVQNLDSTQGVTLVVDGSLDMGFVSRELKAEEKEKLLTEPIGVSGSALAVSSLNSVMNLTRGQARKLLSGEFSDWSMAGGLVGVRPTIIIREPDAATRTALEAYLFTDHPTYAVGAVVATSIDQTLDALHSRGDALAMLTVNQRTLGDAQIRLVGLDGIAPTPDNLASGKYPVRRPLYLTYLKDGTKVKPAMKAFLEFVRAPEGQQLIRDNS
jgi:phosphate transport system substrate-binding protein